LNCFSCSCPFTHVSLYSSISGLGPPLQGNKWSGNYFLYHSHSKININFSFKFFTKTTYKMIIIIKLKSNAMEKWATRWRNGLEKIKDFFLSKWVAYIKLCLKLRRSYIQLRNYILKYINLIIFYNISSKKIKGAWCLVIIF